MEMNLQFPIDDLVNPPVSPSYFSSGEEMDVDIQSVEATVSSSDDSDIEVIACYRQLPVQTQQTVGTRQMTTDLSGCSDDAFQEFPWDDFESLLLTADEQADPLVMGAGPSEGQRTQSPVISQCRQLRPQIDTPLSPPPHERGPYNNPPFSEQQQWNDHPLPLSSHIQGISVRMAAHCGQPNTAVYGDCIVCGRSYEQIKETAVLGYLEATTYRGETYAEQLRKREAYLAGMDQGTVLFVPRGVSQAAACDGNYYQILVEGDNTNPPPGVLPI